jgi:hypothetical protein
VLAILAGAVAALTAERTEEKLTSAITGSFLVLLSFYPFILFRAVEPNHESLWRSSIKRRNFFGAHHELTVER